MNNTKNRLHDVFFYGLYMDEDILKSKNVEARNKRPAIAKGYKLRIGKMATLLRDEKAEAYGLVYSLTQDEIEKLYKGSGLIEYCSEAILIKIKEGNTIACLTCNLISPPEEDEENTLYYEKLIKCMKKYELPLPKDV